MIIANWKSNLQPKEETLLFAEYSNNLNITQTLIVCPSFLSIRECAAQLLQQQTNNQVFIAGQDCSSENNGPHTGQITAQSLFESGCSFCLIGQQGTRTMQKSTRQDLGNKIFRCFSRDLMPIVFLQGSNDDAMVLEQEIFELQNAIKQNPPTEIFIVLEPISSSNNQPFMDVNKIEASCKKIKQALAEIKTSTTIIYGGEATEQNTAQIFSLESINGLLLNNASSNFQELKNMLTYLQDIDKTTQKED